MTEEPEQPPAPDPLGGLRAVVDIQRAGLNAAAAVVERMLELGRLGTRGPFPFPLPAEPNLGANGAKPGEDADPRRDLRRLRGDAERMLELWGEWMRLLLDAAADSAEAGLTPPSVVDGLALGPVAPGGRAVGRAWLHILDGPPTASARLFPTALTASDGATIAAEAISFEPPLVDTFALRTSQELVVAVELPSATAPGTYHGHILAAGLPELSLAVRIEVSA